MTCGSTMIVILSHVPTRILYLCLSLINGVRPDYCVVERQEQDVQMRVETL